MMGWLRLGGDVTASDYLLDSDRMAREVCACVCVCLCLCLKQIACLG